MQPGCFTLSTRIGKKVAQNSNALNTSYSYIWDIWDRIWHTCQTHRPYFPQTLPCACSVHMYCMGAQTMGKRKGTHSIFFSKINLSLNTFIVPLIVAIYCSTFWQVARGHLPWTSPPFNNPLSILFNKLTSVELIPRFFGLLWIVATGHWKIRKLFYCRRNKMNGIIYLANDGCRNLKNLIGINEPKMENFYHLQ